MIVDYFVSSFSNAILLVLINASNFSLDYPREEGKLHFSSYLFRDLVK